MRESRTGADKSLQKLIISWTFRIYCGKVVIIQGVALRKSHEEGDWDE